MTDASSGAVPRAEEVVPNRPRLASFAAARWYEADGRTLLLVHDLRSGATIELPPHVWEALAHADGTRDPGGILLAAARAGVPVRAAEIRDALVRLHAAGLLAAGVEYPLAEAAPDGDRRLDALADVTFACSGDGLCCRAGGAVGFTPAEAKRALALLPDAPAIARRFTPEVGSDGADALSTSSVDGRCAFLTEEMRCSLHAAGGPSGKPRTCRTYPLAYADDGVLVRVSLGLECPCAYANAPGGPPLVPASARVARDLGADPRIAVVPDLVPVGAAAGGAIVAPRDALVAWTQAALDALGPSYTGDVAHACWALADASVAGLDPASAAAALASPDAHEPPDEELAPWLSAAGGSIRAFPAVNAWRGARDVARAAALFLADAVERLEQPMGLRITRADRSSAADELLYLRSTLHGYRLLESGAIVPGLRDRAVRIWLARALGPVLQDAREDPRWPGEGITRHPLSLVEAMMRGHGLRSYVANVGP